jgi:hypothetical protein
VVLENRVVRSDNPCIAVCPDCEVRLVEYHLKWWRQKGEAATAKLDALRVRYDELAAYVDNRVPNVASSRGEQAESGLDNDEKPQAGSTADEGETLPTSPLDQDRKGLLEVCRKFDDAVSVWRVKKSMESFGDKLNSDERLLLAQEIGAERSFIRWYMTEIESHGWQVATNLCTATRTQ